MRPRKNGEHGAVTVLLALAMIPVLLVTGVFVDGARFISADSVVRSNQELAINSVLAQRDNDLHRMFGLLATVSDAGLLDEANNAMLASLAGDPEAGNLLRIDVDTSRIEPVTDASLADAEIMASQITEYMKYRAPVGLVADLLDSLDWLANFKEKVALMEKRVAYFKKINDVAELIQDVKDLVEQLVDDIETFNTTIQQLLADPPQNVLRDAIALALQDEVTASERQAINRRLSDTATRITNAQQQFNAVRSTFNELFGEDGTGGKANELIDKIDEVFNAKEEYESEIDGSENSDQEEKETLKEEAENSVSILNDLKEALTGVADDLIDSINSDINSALDEFGQGVIDDITDQLSSQTRRPTLADIDFALIKAMVDDLTGESEDGPQTPQQVFNIVFPNGITLNISEIVQTRLSVLLESLGEVVQDAAGKVDVWGTVRDVLLNQVPDSLNGYINLTQTLANNRAWDESLVAGVGSDEMSPIIDPTGFDDEDAIKDGISDGSGGGLLGDMGKLLDGLTNVLSTAYENILIADYISGHFTHSALDFDEDNPTRNNHSEFASCRTQKCAAEMEYILTGVNGPIGAVGLVFGLRVVTNMVAAVMDKRVQAISRAAMAIPIVGQAIALLVTPAFAIIQSVIDIKVLVEDGGKVPLFSNRLPLFEPGYSGDGKGLVDAFEGFGDGSAGNSQQGKHGPELSYQDHLVIFIFIAMIGGRDGVIERTGTIIQYNKQYIDGSFELGNAHTSFFVVTEFSVEPLFTNILGSSDAANRLGEGNFRFSDKQTYVAGF